MLEEVEAVVVEHPRVADEPPVTPHVVVLGPGDRCLVIRLGRDGIRNSTVGEALVVGLEDGFGGFGGGSDDGGDGAEAEGHEWAIGFG